VAFRAFCAVCRAPFAAAPVSPGGTIGRAAQTDTPRALTDLELAQPGRPELGDQGRQELGRQPVDGGVIGRPRGVVARSFAGAPWVGSGHGLDLLASRRLVA
jgi:hypothetical protein